MPTMKLGILAKSYRNTGTYGTPVWSEVTCISDWTSTGSWDTVEASTRASRVKSGAKTLFDVGVSGKLKVSDDDTNYLAFRAALFSQTATLDLLVLDGPRTASGVTGVRANFIVSKGDQSQGLGDALHLDITLMPDAYTDSAQQPSSVLVTAGAPVYTAI